MSAPLTLEEAQARLLAAAEPLGAEMVDTANASGRWLAEPLIAHRTSPEADLSAMDGFATAGAGPWRIVGESAAGRPFAGSLCGGQAVRISTGAQVPPGGDAILLREDSTIEGDRVAAEGGAASARYIRRAGFDFARGDELLPAGAAIGPAQLALALAAGVATVAVGRLPAVAIIDTGDELVGDLVEARNGRIPATNGPMLAALCAGLASSVRRIGPVPDDRSALRQAFEGAGGADVIVTSGGASVGDHDLVRPVLEEWGATLDFGRVAIRPGKPVLVARRGAQTIIGLPGNPASAYVTALLFVLPLLRRLAGAAHELAVPRRIAVRLAAPAPSGGVRREFLRARLTEEGIEPLPERDSSALRTLALADALVDRAANAPAAAAGEEVTAVLP